MVWQARGVAYADRMAGIYEYTKNLGIIEPVRMQKAQQIEKRNNTYS